jgi:predicted ATPase
MCLEWLSHLYLLLGQPEQALARDAEVPSLVRELANPNTAAVAHTWRCIFRQLLRDRQSAQAEAGLAVALATEQGFPLYRAAGTAVRGWALADGGQAEAGLAEIRRGLADYVATGAQMWSPYFLGLLAEALGRAGQAGSGLEVLAEALDQVDQIEGRWIEAELHRLRGELLLNLPLIDRCEAEVCFRQGLTVAREQGATMWEVRAATSLGRLWLEQGRRPEVHDLLAPICHRFDGGFETADLRQARVILEGLMCARPSRL